MQQPSPIASVTRPCTVCGTDTTYRCSGCMQPYCSRECQIYDMEHGNHAGSCGAAADEHVGAQHSEFSGAVLVPKERVKEYIGPDLAQYFSGHDVYTIPHTEVRRKNVRPVQTTEKGLVLVGMPDGGAVTFAGARKMLELKNNRAIVRQKLETVSAKSVCARVEFVRMAIEPDGKTAKLVKYTTPGEPSYIVADLPRRDQAALFLHRLARASMAAASDYASTALRGSLVAIRDRAAQVAADRDYFTKNLREVIPNCKYHGAFAPGTNEITMVLRRGLDAGEFVPEIPVTLTMLHELTHALAGIQGREAARVYGREIKIAHGPVFYSTFGAIVRGAALGGTIPKGWADLSPAKVRKYAKLSHFINDIADSLPAELGGSAASSPPTTSGSSDEGRSGSDSDEPRAASPELPPPKKLAAIDLSSGVWRVEVRAGFKTPTYENLDVPLGRKYADKIRALGVGKGAQTIGDMYTIFVYELDGKGGMLQVWLMKNFGMSAELSSELTHKLYHGEFGKRARTLKQALAGPHSGWLVDVPGVDGSAGEDAVKRLLDVDSVVEFVTRWRGMFMSYQTPRTRQARILLTAHLTGPFPTLVDAAKAVDFIDTSVLLMDEDEEPPKPAAKPVESPPKPVTIVAPPPAEPPKKPDVSVSPPKPATGESSTAPPSKSVPMIGCVPRSVKKNFKTALPRSLGYLPKVSPATLERQYKEAHPNTECVTVAMIWKHRNSLGKDGFAKWYTSTTAKQSGADVAITAIEKWFAGAPVPEKEEQDNQPGTMNPPATPGLHSGWLIDVPGFNPKHSEKKYAEFLKVDSVYELVEKYREDKKKTKKLLDKATSQFSKFDAHAARKFLKHAKIV